MGDKTGIEWTDATWNPTVGCSILSPGCTNCYAMKLAARIERMGGKGGAKYAGLTQETKAGPVWTGEVRLDEAALEQPLRWRRRRRIFVNSMSDLFHESLPDEAIDRVFAVMALCPQHTFQVLTKRAARMRSYLAALTCRGRYVRRQGWAAHDPRDGDKVLLLDEGQTWPLPNVWLGVSVEDQARADERVPELLKTPAAVRFLSCEPLLGPVSLEGLTYEAGFIDRDTMEWHRRPGGRMISVPEPKPLHWLICGGESGPAARPMHLAWVRSLIDQCRAAGVPCFVKQMGTFPETDIDEQRGWVMRDRKGGDWSEWPGDLRVREFPHAQR